MLNIQELRKKEKSFSRAYLEELLDLGNPGRSSDEDKIVDGGFVQLGVPHGLLDGLESALEEVGAQLLEPDGKKWSIVRYKKILPSFQNEFF